MTALNLQTNWMIGCVGATAPKPRPFGKSPDLAAGVIDSPGKPVTPGSLYLTQLEYSGQKLW